MSDDEITCELCGRKLRTPESRRRRRGRTCDEKVNPSRGRDHPSRSRPVTAAGMQAAGPDLLDHLPADDRAHAGLGLPCEVCPGPCSIDNPVTEQP